MSSQEPNDRSSLNSPSGKGNTTRRRRPHDVTAARSRAQRTKLDTQAQACQQQVDRNAADGQPKGKTTQESLQARRQAAATLARAIDDYLQDHDGGNHSVKTLEWHRTALGLLRGYLEQEREITLVGEVDAPDISAWFANLRKIPGKHGKPRTERTIQTYARSARAFFHWLVRRETIERNPFDRVVFPKVGSSEALGDQCGAYCTPALDVLHTWL